MQDEGSQLVALAVTRAEVEGGDERWLDLCAGPGGKAALLGRSLPWHAVPTWSPRAAAAPRGARPRAASAVPGGVVDVVTADGTRPAWAGARSTGSSSTPLHRARCAAATARSRGGGGRPATCAASLPLQQRAADLRARVGPSRRRGRLRPARRSSTRAGGCRQRRPRGAPGGPPRGRRRPAAGGRDQRAAAGHGAAVAAPARHRRDVRRGPAPYRLRPIRQTSRRGCAVSRVAVSRGGGLGGGLGARWWSGRRGGVALGGGVPGVGGLGTYSDARWSTSGPPGRPPGRGPRGAPASCLSPTRACGRLTLGALGGEPGLLGPLCLLAGLRVREPTEGRHAAPPRPTELLGLGASLLLASRCFRHHADAHDDDHEHHHHDDDDQVDGAAVHGSSKSGPPCIRT